jgi:hypothetical protein
MIPNTKPDTVNLAELADVLRQVDLAAILIRKRLLRRVLWQHTPGRVHGFGLLRREHYVINKTDLLTIVEADELAPVDAAALPEQVILLGRSNELILGPRPKRKTLQHYWRLLFRARVELAVRENFARDGVSMADIQSRVQRIGRNEFDEITTVLMEEHFLFSADDLLSAYVQFVAQYLELSFFAPQQLAVFFPSLAKRTDVQVLVTAEVDGQAIFHHTRLPGAAEPVVEPKTPRETTIAPSAEKNATTPKAGADHQSAILAAKHGNNVRAALSYVRLACGGESADTSDALALAHFQLRQLADRLGTALHQSESQRQAWFDALLPLLRRGARGYWPAEARLLYDVQKVCLEHENELESVGVWRWLTSFGRQPLRKRIPGKQLVLMLQHLRGAARRLRSVSLTDEEHLRLEQSLAEAMHHQEKKVRAHFRPLLQEALAAVCLLPQNLPEDVARAKLVEELLDRISSNGLLTLSDLRDALARNQLKLDDLAGPGEVVLGDKLLSLNGELAGRLDNVYRPGEFYLRWMQCISALLFGTPWGRLLTRYVLLPFGGAFIALKFCFFMYQEIGHFLPKPEDTFGPELVADETGHQGDEEGSAHVSRTEHKHKGVPTQFPWDPLTTPWSLAGLGIFLFLLLHAPPFRKVVWRGLVLLGHGLHRFLIEGPAWLTQQPAVRAFLGSAPVRFARRFLFKPLIVALLAALVAYLFRARMNTIVIVSAAVYVATGLFLATRLGRALDEILFNWLLEGVHGFGWEVIPALIGWIADLSKRIVGRLERLLYSVDEWFRFRRSEAGITRTFKAIGGMFWTVLAYVVRLLVTLFIEPTFNPVKHFPMVTVAGKFMAVLFAILLPGLKEMLGPVLVWLIGFLLVGCVPGAFGFLVWELKENWRLYRANRPATLKPVLVGHHGETVVHLLAPGFHSGTIPKAYTKWRRAMVRENLRAGFSAEHRLGHVEEAVRHFVERDLLDVLRHSAAGDLPLRVGEVLLGVTQIRFRINSALSPEQPLDVVLALESKSGRLLAQRNAVGWLEQLSESDEQIVQFALAGLYQYAGAALSLEQPISWAKWVAFWDQHRLAPTEAAAGRERAFAQQGH